ncbi:MAG: Uma2 family endonuclease [Nitrospirae bacterium]|nr:Uma2 family endonuclease [Candidatus Troglogloeales bacterium]MBI3597872.1 Uma2 family endonuclease [Candidatus Troglogloeales bacterium]
MLVQVEKRVFSTGEYHKMTEAGILLEDDCVELIEGEIIKMSPIGSRHAACVKRINALLNHRISGAEIVSVQDPILLSDYSEPEPDIALLKFREDFYAQSLPAAIDLLLIIEMADTSVEYDRNIKLPLYARSGIPAVWLVDLSCDAVEAYSEPVNGVYQQCDHLHRGGVLALAGFPWITLKVEEILGECSNRRQP